MQGYCTLPSDPRTSGYFKDKMLLMQAHENRVALDEEQLLFLAGGQDNVVDEDGLRTVHDFALNVDNVFQADDCDAFDSDVDEASTAQTMFMAISSPIFIFMIVALSPSYDSEILSEKENKYLEEFLDMKALKEKLEDKIYKKHVEIERKNLLIANDNLIADCLSKEVFYIAINSELTLSRFTEMHEAHTIVQTRCLELKAELSKLRDKVQKDDHTELVKRFSNLEVNYLNLQLKY
ncbi:hypothetical protein Tco_0213930 [Tanacetum coccineum]